MPRFYFHLENGKESIRDEDGVEADSLREAAETASLVVDEMRESGQLADADSAWALVIRDEANNELRRISV